MCLVGLDAETVTMGLSQEDQRYGMIAMVSLQVLSDTVGVVSLLTSDEEMLVVTACASC